MTAWGNLKALSALAVGTAWQLLTSPKTGGTGGTGVVVNDGIAVEIVVNDFAAMVADIPIALALQPEGYTVEVAPALVSVDVANLAAYAVLASTAVTVELNTDPLETEPP